MKDSTAKSHRYSGLRPWRKGQTGNPRGGKRKERHTLKDAQLTAKYLAEVSREIFEDPAWRATLKDEIARKAKLQPLKTWKEIAAIMSSVAASAAPDEDVIAFTPALDVAIALAVLRANGRTVTLDSAKTDALAGTHGNESEELTASLPPDVTHDVTQSPGSGEEAEK